MPTYTPKAGDTTRSWYVIDATDVVLGRLAVAAANLLRGKHKPTFTPNVDGGDFVIVINADKVAIAPTKLTGKLAYRHSGYPGGLSSRTIGELMQKHPDRVDSNDVYAHLDGGGPSGQAGALRLAIARALIIVQPEDRPALKKAGFLTRDPRAIERKKYGLKKARKAPQYSKR